MRLLSQYTDHAYALMRIMAGFMFSLHGVQKILGLLTDHQSDIGSQAWVGGIIELIGGLLILVGFRTRLAAFMCSGTMAVAYIQFHWKFQLGENFFPVVNRGELAVLYCFVFLFITTRGAVKWGLDRTK